MQAVSLFKSNQQRPRCVIDPALALSYSGLLLYKNLWSVMELWVVRELWYIIDNINLYLQRPELVVPRVNTSTKLLEKRTFLEETLWSLKEWEKLRGERDLNRLNLFWLGENLGNSLIPKEREPEIFSHWESLARSLDSKINQFPSTNDVLTLAFRDAVALAASLGSAFILTYQSREDYEKNLPPDICKALESWDIPCQTRTEKDPIVAIERQYLRQLIINAGLAKLFWADIHIVVLHLVVPSASVQTKPMTNRIIQECCSQEILNLEPENYLWTNIQGFWYQL
ncbi:hypothetical protein [Rivularia sp. UHCC 0363]|uniref:hypothetical protein n=1 Tax=Rivularia sp. UHCC 0363 TaxID=3110244 RepID=UPI003A598EE9